MIFKKRLSHPPNPLLSPFINRHVWRKSQKKATMSHSLCCERFKKRTVSINRWHRESALTIKPSLYQVDCWITEILPVAVTILQFNRLKDPQMMVKVTKKMLISLLFQSAMQKIVVWTLSFFSLNVSGIKGDLFGAIYVLNSTTLSKLLKEERLILMITVHNITDHKHMKKYTSLFSG